MPRKRGRTLSTVWLNAAVVAALALLVSMQGCSNEPHVSAPPKAPSVEASRIAAPPSAVPAPDVLRRRAALYEMWYGTIKPRFVVAARTPEETAVISSISLHVVVSPEANAWAFDAGYITISDRMLEMMNLSSDAVFLTSWNRQTLDKPFMSYLQYLSGEYYKANKGVSSTPDTFQTFASIPPEQAAAWLADPRYVNARRRVLLDSTAVLLGHEVGHVFLKHKNYDQETKGQARRNEFAADHYGYEIASAAGFRAFFGFMTFTIYADSEQMALDPAESSTHPSGLCRVFQLVEQISSDPVARKVFDQSAEKDNHPLERVSKLFTQMDAKCAETMRG